MSTGKRHKKDLDRIRDQSARILGRMQIPFRKSKEEVWEELSERRRTRAPYDPGEKQIGPGRSWIALAASVTLLVAVGSIMRFYRVHSHAPPGEHAAIELPDGSLAELNARTTLSYKPLWWFFSRKVNLEGEAFFLVEAGQTFTVATSMGTTEVLGTAFNVYAREDGFNVTCHTGRVRVTSARSKESIKINQDERAEMDAAGTFNIREVKVDPIAPAWKQNILMFISSPLREVFDAIERQYDISIETREELNYMFSGRFELDQSVEKVLTLVCRPFDLVYERKSGSEYRVFSPGVD